MGKYFGTDGFRGEAGVQLTAEHAFKIGRFFGALAAKGAAEGSDIVVESHAFGRFFKRETLALRAANRSRRAVL